MSPEQQRELWVAQDGADRLWASLRDDHEQIAKLAHNRPGFQDAKLIRKMASLVYFELVARAIAGEAAEAEAPDEVQAPALPQGDQELDLVRTAIASFAAAARVMVRSVHAFVAQTEGMSRGELRFVADEVREVEASLKSAADRFSEFVANTI
jgi:uncharacterized protein YoaH (UPF0181 family)